MAARGGAIHGNLAENFAVRGTCAVIPGAPGTEPPTVAEPTEPRVPLPPKPANNRRT
jgi:hypothetical protein